MLRYSRFNLPGLAGIAALILGAAVVGVAEAQTIGRLFSTPQERAALNELRREFEFGTQPVEAEEVIEIERLSVDGIVLRSSGNNAAWINQATILEGDATREGIRVEASDTAGGTVRIVLPNRRDAFEVKPGQKIDVTRGDVLDAYQPEPERADPTTIGTELTTPLSGGTQPAIVGAPQTGLPPGW